MSQTANPGDGVTLVASHRVAPGKVREFERILTEFAETESRFPGFVGTEVVRPVPGVQDEWITLIRFDDQAHLRAWVESDQRRDLLARLDPCVERLDVREMGGSFGAWFARDEHADRPPPNWKQAMTVLLVLYPAVMLITLYLAPHLGAAMNANIFIGNVVSVAALTWLLMPLATRVLRSWLSADARPKATIIGLAAILAAYAVEVLAFSSATLPK